jgi:hypothetical protein
MGRREDPNSSCYTPGVLLYTWCVAMCLVCCHTPGVLLCLVCCCVWCVAMCLVSCHTPGVLPYAWCVAIRLVLCYVSSVLLCVWCVAMCLVHCHAVHAQGPLVSQVYCPIFSRFLEVFPTSQYINSYITVMWGVKSELCPQTVIAQISHQTRRACLKSDSYG